MTLGDIIDKIVVLFGGEPKKSRALRKRVMNIVENIKKMEDGLRDSRKRVRTLEDKIADLKRDLKATSSGHEQDFIMDEIERLDKEFSRERDLANLKGENVDAARTLRAKLEQLLENALHGANAGELESVLEKVESLGDDMKDVRDLVNKLDTPSSIPAPKKSEKAVKKMEEDRAARRARLLGETAAAKPVETNKPAQSDAKEASETSSAAEPSTPEERISVAG